MNMESLLENAESQKVNAKACFDDSFIDLQDSTEEQYRRYLDEFLEYIKMDAPQYSTYQGFYEYAKRLDDAGTPQSKDALNKIFAEFKKWMGNKDTNYLESTLNLRKKGINKFLEACGLDIRISTKKMKHTPRSTIKLDHIIDLLDTIPTGDLRRRAIVMTLKDTGLAVAEAAELTVEDFREAYEVRINDLPYRRWRKPVKREKTDELCWVHVGVDAIKAIDYYIGTRKSGPIFLTMKGQPHYNQEGEQVGYTEIGEPLKAHAISRSMQYLAKPLKAKGLRISAHSFRSLFTTSFSVEGKLEAAHKIMGKAINDSDEPYLHYEDKLTEVYADVYEKHLLLDKEKRQVREELDAVKRESETLWEMMGKMAEYIFNQQTAQPPSEEFQEFRRQFNVPTDREFWRLLRERQKP
jgi:integrase